MPIDVLDWSDAVTRIAAWSASRQSRVVCICNVHSVVTAQRDAEFRKVLLEADMATADGAPVAFMLRRRGHLNQERINGPDLMLKCCARAAEDGHAIYLYGGTPETLRLLQNNLRMWFPNLNVAGAYSPPFRTLSYDEDQGVVDAINESGARIVWIGLGCPKQEKWMAAHCGRINSVLVGVGAAFDYHAGTIHRAPLWMQRNGLEWLHRLAHQPRRLWRRYLVTNSLFIWYTTIQLLKDIRR